MQCGPDDAVCGRQLHGAPCPLPRLGCPRHCACCARARVSASSRGGGRPSQRCLWPAAQSAQCPLWWCGRTRPAGCTRGAQETPGLEQGLVRGCGTCLGNGRFPSLLPLFSPLSPLLFPSPCASRPSVLNISTHVFLLCCFFAWALLQHPACSGLPNDGWGAALPAVACGGVGGGGSWIQCIACMAWSTGGGRRRCAQGPLPSHTCPHGRHWCWYAPWLDPLRALGEHFRSMSMSISTVPTSSPCVVPPPPSPPHPTPSCCHHALGPQATRTQGKHLPGPSAPSASPCPPASCWLTTPPLGAAGMGWQAQTRGCGTATACAVPPLRALGSVQWWAAQSWTSCLVRAQVKSVASTHTQTHTHTIPSLSPNMAHLVHATL